MLFRMKTEQLAYDDLQQHVKELQVVRQKERDALVMRDVRSPPWVHLTFCDLYGSSACVCVCVCVVWGLGFWRPHHTVVACAARPADCTAERSVGIADVRTSATSLRHTA